MHHQAFKEARDMQGGVPQSPPPPRRCAEPINTNDTYRRYLITVRLEPKDDRKRSSMAESIKSASISVFV